MATIRKDVVALVHHRQARLPQECVTKMFIFGVPKEVSLYQVKERLDAAGRRFGDFGVRWANHSLERLNETSPGVQADLQQGNVESLFWSDLVKESDPPEPMLLRIPASLKSALKAKAEAASLSLNEYCARELARAAQ